MKRTVNFKVSADGAITPALPQYAGVRGEHNTAEVVFDVSAWNGEAFVYRAEFVDGCGSGDTTEVITKDASGRITVPLPRAWTNAGGQAVLRLVVSVMEGGVETQTALTVDAPLQFSDKQNATGQIGGVGEKGLTQLIMETRAAQENAQAVADEILRMAEEGAFDGKDGIDGKDGVDGKDGADGTDGEDGKNGTDGIDGQDAIMPISYINPRLSGYPPRYHYEIYTPWESLPDNFLFQPFLSYGLQSGDGWGMTIFTAAGVASWVATEANFDGWDIDKGYHVFAYASGSVTRINGDKGESITVESIEESTEDGGANAVTFSDGNVLRVKNGSKGDIGTSVQQTLLYENEDGLSQTYTEITVADPAEYDYFVVVTEKGTFPIYQGEKLNGGYISGGTFVSVGGGGFYALSVCFGANGETWTPYEMAYFNVISSGIPAWGNTSTQMKVYKIIGVKTSAAMPTWNGGAY